MWYNNKDIRIEDIPKPIADSNEMLVQVESCGICGSDIVEWYRLPRAPLVPGHEIGGIVVETGKNVTKCKPGDRVFIAPKVPCMECEYCKNEHHPVCSNVHERLPGGFSECILVPEVLIKNGTYFLTDNISYDQSTFIEPLSCAVRAQKLAKIKKNQTILIMGCGISGIIHIKLAKTKQCKIIAVDINENRLLCAKKSGADVIINANNDVSSQLVDKNNKKADIVMLCTSAMSAIEHAWNCVDKGGAIVFFAVPGPEKKVVIPMNKFWTGEIRILTSYYCSPNDINEAISLIENEKIFVDDMITHKLPLKEIIKGFQLVANPQNSLKVIIKPNE